jgi:hypothetical protein
MHWANKRYLLSRGERFGVVSGRIKDVVDEMRVKKRDVTGCSTGGERKARNKK